MNPLFGLLERVDALMRELEAPWAVVGGMAMVLRVQARLTQDVDVVLLFPISRAREVAERARSHQFTFDEADFSAFGEAGLVRLWGPGEPRELGADLIFVDSRFLERVVERATPVPLPPSPVPVATVEDLLLLKLEANRPRDLDDAIAIKDVHGATLDRGYLKAQGEALDLTARLEALLGPL